MEFERRLGDHFTVTMEGQWFAKNEPEDLTYAFRDDTFLQTALRIISKTFAFWLGNWRVPGYFSPLLGNENNPQLAP